MEGRSGKMYGPERRRSLRGLESTKRLRTNQDLPICTHSHAGKCLARTQLSKRRHARPTKAAHMAYDQSFTSSIGKTVFLSIFSPLQAQQETNLVQLSTLLRRKDLTDEDLTSTESKKVHCPRLCSPEKDRNTVSLLTSLFLEFPRIVDCTASATRFV